ncbi:MAG TPA: hypothetical protein VGG64_21940 [Pirellulales bacterium]|jgi:hypothetical protein
MTPESNCWLRRLGFYVWYVPGISRAWRLDFASRDHLLVTDVGGYDLPGTGGPYASILVLSTGAATELHSCLNGTIELVDWVERTIQLYIPRSRQVDRAMDTMRSFRRAEERRSQLRWLLSRR